MESSFISDNVSFESTQQNLNDTKILTIASAGWFKGTTIYLTSFNFFFFFLDELYDVSIGILILLSVFYGSISIIAVVGNSLVIWIVATTRQMQTVTNLFIANLAFADVIIGMFAIPFQVKFSNKKKNIFKLF